MKKDSPGHELTADEQGANINDKYSHVQSALTDRDQRQLPADGSLSNNSVRLNRHQRGVCTGLK